MPRFYAQIEVLVDADNQEQAEEYFSEFIEKVVWTPIVEWRYAPSPVNAVFLEVPHSTTLVR